MVIPVVDLLLDSFRFKRTSPKSVLFASCLIFTLHKEDKDRIFYDLLSTLVRYGAPRGLLSAPAYRADLQPALQGLRPLESLHSQGYAGILQDILGSVRQVPSESFSFRPRSCITGARRDKGLCSR